MTRPLKALIVGNVLGLVALAVVLSLAPPRVARDGQPSAFPYAPPETVIGEQPAAGTIGDEPESTTFGELLTLRARG